MKIIDNREDAYFGEIDIGECFEYNNTIYMRVYPAHDENSGDHFNAVSLRSGETDYFSDDDVIITVEVSLVRNR